MKTPSFSEICKPQSFAGAFFASILAWGVACVAFGQDVAALESGLRTSILEKVDEVNPVDPATGARKYISFGFISDIHKCKRVPGDDASANPVTDYWYGSAGILTEAEQSIRLLGSVAADAGLDAVINGGDLSTAPISNKKGLTEAEYTNEIWNVKAMFDKYLPAGVPLFTVDGNHERNYVRNGANMQLSDEAWAYVLTNFNTSSAAARTRGVEVTYHRDLKNATLDNEKTGQYAGNSYHLDFRRLHATKGYNVRIACISSYDKSPGSAPKYRVYDAAQFYNPFGGLPYDVEKVPENTIMGMVSHEPLIKVAGTLLNGYMNMSLIKNPAVNARLWNGSTHPGMGFFGLVCAHAHTTNVKEIRNAFDMQANPSNTVFASMVQVACAHAVNKPCNPKYHQLGTEKAYHFSIFVVDTDKELLREVRVGGWGNAGRENPVVQIHDTHIRTNIPKFQPSAKP